MWTIHLDVVTFQPTDAEVAEATPDERAMLAGAARCERELSGYMRLQNTRPRSVAFALATRRWGWRPGSTPCSAT